MMMTLTPAKALWNYQSSVTDTIGIFGQLVQNIKWTQIIDMRLVECVAQFRSRSVLHKSQV